MNGLLAHYHKERAEKMLSELLQKASLFSFLCRICLQHWSSIYGRRSSKWTNRRQKHYIIGRYFANLYFKILQGKRLSSDGCCGPTQLDQTFYLSVKSWQLLQISWHPTLTPFMPFMSSDFSVYPEPSVEWV